MKLWATWGVILPEGPQEGPAALGCRPLGVILMAGTSRKDLQPRSCRPLGRNRLEKLNYSDGARTATTPRPTPRGALGNGGRPGNPWAKGHPPDLLLADGQ